MAKKAVSVEYRLVDGAVRLTGVHRTDRGSRYLGRSFLVEKEGLSKSEFEQKLLPFMEALLTGSEPS